MRGQLFYWAGCFLAAGLLLAAPQRLPAQDNDPRAKKILDAVSAKYRAQDFIKADFSYTMSEAGGSGSQTENGSLYVQPGGDKYRIQIAGQELISDGATSWVYLKEVNEVQVGDAAASSGQLNPAELFTLHEEGFKYLLKGDGTVDGKAVSLIDLVPLESSPYSKMELAVEKQGNLVRQLKVFDKNGNHYIYKINSVDFNPGLKNDFFTFKESAHPGVEVVDLR